MQNSYTYKVDISKKIYVENIYSHTVQYLEGLFPSYDFLAFRPPCQDELYLTEDLRFVQASISYPADKPYIIAVKKFRPNSLEYYCGPGAENGVSVVEIYHQSLSYLRKLHEKKYVIVDFRPVKCGESCIDSVSDQIRVSGCAGEKPRLIVVNRENDKHLIFDRLSNNVFFSEYYRLPGSNSIYYATENMVLPQEAFIYHDSTCFYGWRGATGCGSSGTSA